MDVDGLAKKKSENEYHQTVPWNQIYVLREDVIIEDRSWPFDFPFLWNSRVSSKQLFSTPRVFYYVGSIKMLCYMKMGWSWVLGRVFLKPCSALLRYFLMRFRRDFEEFLKVDWNGIESGWKLLRSLFWKLSASFSVFCVTFWRRKPSGRFSGWFPSGFMHTIWDIIWNFMWVSRYLRESTWAITRAFKEPLKAFKSDLEAFCKLFRGSQ